MSSKSPGPDRVPEQSSSSSSSSSNSDDEYSIEDSEAVTDSTSSSNSDNVEEEELDEFDQFLKYRPGTSGKFQSHHRVPPVNDDDLMCFYYFSDALGLTFGGSKSEEVYRLDQIKEWDPPESKWLVPPNILGT